MATKLEGGGKALVARPLRDELFFFFAASLRMLYVFFYIRFKNGLKWMILKEKAYFLVDKGG